MTSTNKKTMNSSTISPLVRYFSLLTLLSILVSFSACGSSGIDNDSGTGLAEETESIVEEGVTEVEGGGESTSQDTAEEINEEVEEIEEVAEEELSEEIPVEEETPIVEEEEVFELEEEEEEEEIVEDISDEEPLASPTQTIRIMPMGDSITEAEGGHSSYRFWLWDLLQGTGGNFDFVGSQRGVFRGTPRFTNFDQDHQGHWGFRVDQLLSLAPAAAAFQPDIVLLHIGTNDVRQGESADSTVNDIARIIDIFRQSNSDVVVLLAQVIPTNRNNDRIQFLNGNIAQLANLMDTDESPVVLVDQFSGFSLTTNTYDGVHPNDSGELRMAQRWFNALQPFI